ncbi:carbohydrate ABC transporter permease [Neobacillus sp. CF12]|uniref:carbohydrate ABC transporter permease n=1 Tax=Neobacillus sp. CF12 TaxID=3055864 RepID=UPI0025A279DD|nr:carbohydrate ABC transporter permease [Neobacillus sp. CF12]MDM5326234.1 carbohydrate ABC transporter permease [Neobacillus sp. CF12]
MRIKQKAGNILVYSILILLLIYWLFPLFIAILNSFKTNGELLTNVLSLPKELQFENYTRTFEKMNYARSLMNTVIVASIGVSLMIFFSAMAGWRLARTKTKLSTFIFGLFVFSMLVPFSSIMIPLYKIMLLFNMNNSLMGLGLVYTGLGVSMAIFLYHGFVKSIPKEIEESALMDGCRPFQIFIYIIFPLLKPVTVTVCITNVLWIWNDFLLPLIAISDNEKYTLLLSTNTLFGQYSSDWGAILSALILAAIPVIVFYVIFQKSILKGIAEGATKG